MLKVTVVIRELRTNKPDYSLEFHVPEIPQIGSYISINRSDTPQPYSEDLVVRHVWWRLHHPETRAVVSGTEKVKVGALTEVFIECDPALGPYSSDRWRARLEHAEANGARVEKFQVQRFSVRQSDLEEAGDT